jgi:hypothetical protein
VCVERLRAMFETWNAGALDLAVLPKYLDPRVEPEGRLTSSMKEP